MNFASRLAALALPLLLLAGSAAGAEEIEAARENAQGSAQGKTQGNARATHEAEIGTGLVCDTQQQVERFVSLYDGDTPGTVKKVNDAEGDPTACGVAAMAFVRGRALATARHKDATFQIVPILVLGIITDSGVESVTPSAFFSAIQIEEIEV